MPETIRRQARVLSSSLLSTLDLWRGTMLVHAARQPKKRLRLYDLEGEPACRQVREALTALGLDADVFPCPIGGTRYRPKAEALAGAGGFPLLVDANTGDTLIDGPTIIAHLFRTYAEREPPAAYRPGPMAARLAELGSMLRAGRGLQARPARRPRRRLQLWSFESSPYSRLVRERLTELELAYTLHNVGKEHWTELGPAALRLRPGPYRPRPGGRREQLLARWGRVQLPYFEDPNTGAAMFESADIIAYLEQHYAREPQR
ncbi:MAG: glutathione S-transferase N-terminal domain-containing protein [Burkholderiaceae bacterium]|nr:glutathione S-transferase N-terminal domain-containing protein [Rhodoferax sp.]